MRTFLTTGVAVLAAGLLGGCDDSLDSSQRAALVVQPMEAPAATAEVMKPAVEPAALPARSQRVGRSTTTGITVSPTNQQLRALSAELPWAGSPDGNWMGTGHEDPEELRKISDKEMVERALSGEGLDREHALVSVGRRRAPGAIEAFAKVLDAEAPYALREMAISGLVEHGGPEALPLMWKVLREDDSPRLRGQAIWAIAFYGASEARKAIDAGLAEDEPVVQGMAVLAVWALKDHPDQALPILSTAAESSQILVYQEALYTLSRMPYPAAADILERLTRQAGDDVMKMRLTADAYRTWMRNFPELRK